MTGPLLQLQFQCDLFTGRSSHAEMSLFDRSA